MNAALTLARDESGEFLLSADLLAQRIGWPTETLRDMMRRGLVSSRVGRGERDDAGRWRLSVRCGNRRWQATVEADGRVGEQRLDVLPAAPKKAR
ncbi:DUF6522 family protein [Shinella sp. M31]|uniref:DUF6522 family protein n=1 Tax=Shinella sp. M31 TaxID=3368615 RepID=UPI003BA19D26